MNALKKYWWIVATLFAIGGAWFTLNATVDTNTKTIAKHESAIREIELHVERHDEKINAMGGDLKEIKQDVKQLLRR